MALEHIRDYFVLANTLDLFSIPAIDFHIHTDFTDARMNVHSVVIRAECEKLNSIGFTDHARRDSTYVRKYVSTIRAIRETTPVKIFIGLEVKILDLEGNLDICEDDKTSLDFVSASLHRYPSRNGGYLSVSELSPVRAARIETEASIAMIEKRKADVLNHLGKIHLQSFGSPMPTDNMCEIIHSAKGNGVAIEINTKTSNWKEILQECINQKALITLGSDAHDLHEIGDAYRAVRQFFNKR